MFSPRICILCGKQFVPTSSNQKCCKGPHFTTCQVCGKEFEFKTSWDRPKTCSKECQHKLQELTKQKTLLERYGVTNVSKLDSVKQKISEKNSSVEVRKRREATCLERYGATNPSKSIEIKEKLSEIMSSEEYLKKREETCIERYGAASPMQNAEIIEKRRQASIEKYGKERPSFSKSYFEKILTDGSKVENFLSFKEDPEKYVRDRYEVKPTYSQLMQDLGCTQSPIYDVLSEKDCLNLVERPTSQIEKSVEEFLYQLLPDAIIKRNDRKVIKPLELDFYLPEYNVAFECNPAISHNSTGGFYGKVSPSYHLNKTLLCEAEGIQLFHIFGYEWVHKQEIMKSQIANIFRKSSNKVGARETYFDEISFKECRDFLDQNHRQGSTVSKIRLGLRRKSDDELVSVMTFGKLRKTQGLKSTTTEKTWELSRFCSKLNTVVSGGASKLLKEFLIRFNPEKVVSFSDRAHSTGKLYETLGFKKVNETAPNYFWTDLFDSVCINRVSSQKHHLKRLLQDDSIDLNQSETEIMTSHNFVKVFDSGLIRWELDC